MAEEGQPDLAALTVQLLSAYVSNNTVPSSELAGLIESTRRALSGETASIEAAAPVADPVAPVYAPAVSVDESLASPDSIISLIDGKPYKTLKRHLSTRGLTPVEYRSRYNLPADYPMVAPGYSEQRRAVAHKLGLGRKKVVDEAAPAQAKTSDAEPGTTVADAAETKALPVAKPKRAVRGKGASSGAGRRKAGDPSVETVTELGSAPAGEETPGVEAVSVIRPKRRAPAKAASAPTGEPLAAANAEPASPDVKAPDGEPGPATETKRRSPAKAAAAKGKTVKPVKPVKPAAALDGATEVKRKPGRQTRIAKAAAKAKGGKADVRAKKPRAPHKTQNAEPVPAEVEEAPATVS
jgi:predicted transcriptional regulator